MYYYYHYNHYHYSIIIINIFFATRCWDGLANRGQLVQNSLGNKISLYALLRLRKLLIETENKPKINLYLFS